jgi:hypothetical protein
MLRICRLTIRSIVGRRWEGDSAADRPELGEPYLPSRSDPTGPSCNRSGSEPGFENGSRAVASTFRRATCNF